MTHWSERHRVLLAIFLVLRRPSDGKVLLLRRANTGYRDGWLSMPAATGGG